MSRCSAFALIVLAAGLALSDTAWATETVSYTYDARGRVIRVVRDKPATINDAQVCYKYDKADNRVQVKAATNVNVSSPPACPP